VLYSTAQATLSPDIRVSGPDNGVVPLISRRNAMKTIFSALVALTVLATVAVPASADWNPQDFWRQSQVGP
jgi:hypothetical protein